eukprot:4169033-Pyramimonas_sp.AAC.1
MMFQVPQVDLTGFVQPSDWTGPAPPGCLPDEHPADDRQDLNHEGDSRGDLAPPVEDRAPPLIGALAEHGRDALSAMITYWWKCW